MPPRQTALDKFRDDLVRTWGNRVATVREQTPEGPLYDVISSGSLTIDYALRLGGFIRGRVHELVGSPDSAKTTIMINAMAAAQVTYPKLLVGYVDIEGTFDDYWAALNGLDLGNRFDHLYADDSEDASDQARKLCRSGLYSLVVVDSIGGMESRKALEKNAEDTLVGRNAQVITRMCKGLASYTRQTGTTVILVNQLRANIGGMGADISAGPKPMQHATTTRIQMGRGPEAPVSMIVEEGMDAEPVASQFKARVTRSKGFAPGRIATFWVNNRPTAEYGPAGLNRADEYLTLGIRTGAIRQEGTWYTVPGIAKPVQGRTAAARVVRENPGTFKAIREPVLAAASAGSERS
jgi:recombination protein RecA